MRIFLFIVDSLRHDHVGVYNPGVNITPQIDRIAEGGWVFENAFSQSNWTYPSLYSLLTGLYPQRLELTFFNQKILAPDRILPEILACHGYHTALFSSFKTLINPKTFGSHFKERRLIRISDGAVKEFRRWLQDNRDRDNIFLLFHVGDFTHVPYCIPASFQKNKPTLDISQSPIIETLTTEHSGEAKIKEIFKKINARLIRLKPQELRFLKNCYSSGVQYIDGFIGKCFDSLSEEQDDYLFAISADHGECFLEHGLIGHGVGLYNELIKIPLIISCPEISSKRIDTAVQLLDFYPTICELVGINIRKLKIDGVSLLKSQQEAHRSVISDAYPLISIINRDYKLISSYLKFITKKDLFKEFKKILKAKRIGRLAYHLKSFLIKDELYNIKVDIEERNNLRGVKKKIYFQMKQSLREYTEHDQDIKIQTQYYDIEEEIKAQLEGLGYY